MGWQAWTEEGKRQTKMKEEERKEHSRARHSWAEKKNGGGYERSRVSGKNQLLVMSGAQNREPVVVLEILGKLGEPQVESEPRANPSRGVVFWNVGAFLYITRGKGLLPALGIPTRLSRVSGGIQADGQTGSGTVVGLAGLANSPSFKRRLRRC